MLIWISGYPLVPTPRVSLARRDEVTARITLHCGDDVYVRRGVIEEPHRLATSPDNLHLVLAERIAHAIQELARVALVAVERCVLEDRQYVNVINGTDDRVPARRADDLGREQPHPRARPEGLTQVSGGNFTARLHRRPLVLVGAKLGFPLIKSPPHRDSHHLSP